MRMTRLTMILALLAHMPAGAAESPSACVDGMAGTHGCARVDLLGHLSPAELGGSPVNDIWGWTDPVTDREYAIVGRTAGTSFVDITDPSDPVLIGTLLAHDDIVSPSRFRAGYDGTGGGGKSGQCTARRSQTDDGHEHGDGEGACQGSLWRDLKVYDDHAFIVSEAGGHGLQIFDLTQLRTVAAPPESFDETAHYNAFSNAHNVVIDTDSGYLYAVGTNTFAGGLHIVDVSNPAAPVAAGGYSADGYTHDAQCVVYAGPDAAHLNDELCFNANEDTLTVVDVSDKGSMSLISRTPYPGVAYTHQAWLSGDHRWLFLNDELDELGSNGTLRPRMYVWDVSDLSSPQLVATYDSPSWGIDHNNYEQDSYLYMAHYASGMRVLDVSDPQNPWEAGFFDTSSFTDSPARQRFVGAWSVYPYFPSGSIVVSDSEGGLYVLGFKGRSEPLAASDLRVLPGSGTIELEEDASTVETFEVMNAGSETVREVSFWVSTPRQVSAVPDSDDGWVCATTGDGFAVHCTLDELLAGASASLDVTLSAEATGNGTIQFQAGGLLTDSQPGDNRASRNVSVEADDPPPATGGGGGGGGGPLGPLGLVGLLSLSLRRMSRGAIAARALLVLGAIAMVPSAHSATLIHAGTLIDGVSDRAMTERTIVIEDGHVVSVERGFREPGADDRLVDLSEATVLPGLIDMHTHHHVEFGPRRYLEAFTLEPTDYALKAAARARRTLDAGFTTVREVGDVFRVSVALRDAIARGDTVGPRMFTAGKSIATTGGHADPSNGWRHGVLPEPGPEDGVVDGPEEAWEAVRSRYQEGADLIKITATGGVLSVASSGDNPQFTVEELEAVIAAARDYGFSVAAHAHGAEGMRRAVEAGVDSIEHGTYLDDEVMALMVERGTYLVPTLSAGRWVLEKSEIDGFFPEVVRVKAATVGAAMESTLQRALAAGVPIAFGTDSGVSAHGDNAMEFIYMVEAGMEPMDAIRSATSVAADLLGRGAKLSEDAQRLGRIGAGAYADIVAVRGDPLSDISELTRIGFVMKGGETVRDEISHGERR